MTKTTFVSIALGLVLLTALPLSPRARAVSPGLVVVVAAGFPLTDIRLAVLRRLYEGINTDINGKRMIAINHPYDTPTRIEFDRAVLGLEPDAVGQFWVDRRIRDEGMPPRAVRSEELALRVVASLPGAITYVSPGLVNASVRALTIEGKRLGESGYPLAP